MKRKHIDAQALAGNVPPPSSAFETEAVARLYALAAEEEMPMRRKKLSIILVAALLIVLLAATALAMGLRRSAEADAITRARQAIAADYGLTTETLGVLVPMKKELVDGIWTIQFPSMGGFGDNDEKVGSYTVVLAPGEPPQTSWSHDGVDPSLWADGNMDAPVWGHPQILQALKEKEAQLQAYAEVDWSAASFEEKAAFASGMWILDGAGDAEKVQYAVPGAEDLPPEQVEAAARKVAMETYGLTEAVMETYAPDVSFVQRKDSEDRLYVVTYTRREPTWAQVEVYFGSPDGEVIGCIWTVDKMERTLPEGPLDGYEKAVRAYIEEGSFAVQPAAVKADIVQRARAAGLDDLMEPMAPYAVPGDADIPEAAAMAASESALLDVYGIDAAMRALFLQVSSLLDTPEGRHWVMDYIPVPITDTSWMELEEKLGAYTVTLDAADGALLDVVWSLEEVWEDRGYTRENWATAPALHGKLLPWLLALQKEAEEITGRYPEDATIYDYSVEDAGHYDALFRAAGFSDSTFFRHAPTDEDIPYEEARTLAKQALMEEMDVTLEALDGADGIAELTDRASDPNPRQWCLSFYVRQEGIAVNYVVTLDARTGEILWTDGATGGNG